MRVWVTNYKKFNRTDFYDPAQECARAEFSEHDFNYLYGKDRCSGSYLSIF